MAVRENVVKVLKDLILPELHAIRSKVERCELRLDSIDKRLDEHSARFMAIDQHLVDQSRRIDQVSARVDQLREELGARIDQVREELVGRIDQQTARIDQQGARIDQLTAQVGVLTGEVVAIRQERTVIDDLVRRVTRLEQRPAA